MSYNGMTISLGLSGGFPWGPYVKTKWERWVYNSLLFPWATQLSRSSTRTSYGSCLELMLFCQNTPHRHFWDLLTSNLLEGMPTSPSHGSRCLSNSSMSRNPLLKAEVLNLMSQIDLEIISVSSKLKRSFHDWSRKECWCGRCKPSSILKYPSSSS